MSSTRIYPVDGGYVVADDGGWVPGLYATEEEAAQAAAGMAAPGFERPRLLPSRATLDKLLAAQARMVDGWAESTGQARNDLWREVHDAADKVRAEIGEEF